jgi:HNH endonuclease
MEDTVPQKRIPTIVRYFTKVDQSAGPDGCWPWTGAPDQDGYGIFWDGTYRENGAGHYVRVTRWTFEQFVGPIPDRQQVLHHCDNPPCVNPVHLFTGTVKTNHEDREVKGRGRRMHGATHVESKLTDDQVREIRTRYAAGGISQRALSLEFGVSNQLISGIIRRAKWAHI